MKVFLIAAVHVKKKQLPQISEADCSTLLIQRCFSSQQGREERPCLVYKFKIKYVSVLSSIFLPSSIQLDYIPDGTQYIIDIYNTAAYTFLIISTTFV